jgi:hypothetical protein
MEKPYRHNCKVGKHMDNPGIIYVLVSIINKAENRAAERKSHNRQNYKRQWEGRTYHCDVIKGKRERAEKVRRPFGKEF